MHQSHANRIATLRLAAETYRRFAAEAQTLVGRKYWLALAEQRELMAIELAGDALTY